MIRPVAKSGVAVSLESLLLEKRLISPDQISLINQFIAENGTNFGTAVMFLGLVPAYRLSELVFQIKKIPTGSPQKVSMSPLLKSSIAPEKAKELQVFPLQLVDESGSRVLVLGMTDPCESIVIQRVESLTKMRVQPVFVSLDDLQWAYKKYYRSGLVLFPSEKTDASEKTVNRRVEMVAKVATDPAVSRSAEFKALVSLLVARGIFTHEEFQKEVKKYAS